ncbi:protein of unknown function [Beijerinckiaceae bacterium RH AL1]|nr:AraC family transcriptional regulator [Beijerinckiaceae bacterium]VVB47641.1 protein of unknown function [Beijerinckiaceae bacterium RH CH11]VVB47722.1 protein of unknown function [Beijerinckiaceae bacterium RH AL8]VVC55991.1 protein of unknown function [Beijerinckiaceae bacterium RH AL1]
MTWKIEGEGVVRHYGAPKLASKSADWGHVRATLIRRERIEGVRQQFLLPWPAFRLGLSGTFARGSTQRLNDLPAVPLVTQKDHVSFFPAQTTIRNDLVGASRLSYLMVEIDQAIADDAGAGAGPVVGADDPVCLALLRGFKSEIERPGTTDRLLAETMALALMLSIRRPSHADERRKTTPAGLAPRQLALVTDYITDCLTHDVSLGELAALVDLSRSQLCRAFKIATGTTPHRWRTQVRIERAKDLLTQTKLPLADIAQATGFADQSHFTTVFKKSSGTTPRAWRLDHDG